MDFGGELAAERGRQALEFTARIRADHLRGHGAGRRFGHGLGSLFLVSRLRPGKKTLPIVPGVFDDRFALVIEETDATFDAAAVSELLRNHHAVEIEERVWEADSCSTGAAGGAAGSRSRRRLNYLLLLVLIVLVAANMLVPRNQAQPNREFLPDMAHSPAYTSESANPNFADGETLQPPVLGTLAAQARTAALRGDRRRRSAGRAGTAQPASGRPGREFASTARRCFRTSARPAMAAEDWATAR